jgi:hypothetical protein
MAFPGDETKPDLTMPQDPEEGTAGLRLINIDEDLDQLTAAPSPDSPPSPFRRRALWTACIASAAGVLLYALFTHLPGLAKNVGAAVEDAEQKQAVMFGFKTCPGTLNIPGLSQVAIINTKPDPTDTEMTPYNQIEVEGNQIIANIKGRAYFGDQCVENTYDPNYYKGFPLLGNTLKYTIDLHGAGCGCNAAVYLSSLRQNTDISTCGDYYCDANSVCGVSCTELDIQEANMFSWHSTLHTSDDKGGIAFGYGGTGDMQSSWTDGQYGPGGTCIDTGRPFQVAVSFPVNADNTLQAMQVTLTQQGSPCPLSGSISSYQIAGRDGMPEVTRALQQGMTPVVSYWAADDMTWLDGEGPKGGRCSTDVASQCPQNVRIYDIAFEKGAASVAPTAPQASTPVVNSPSITALQPQTNDPEWAVYQQRDTFAFHDVHQMDAADINACKAYARANNVDAFVVWRGIAYFRGQNGADCYANLEDSSEATTYILRSSFSPSGYSATPAVQSPSPSQGLVPAGNVGFAETAQPNWDEARSTDGSVYYYNTQTGQTAWHLPQ